MSPSALGFVRIKAIALAVKDLARAERFYSETLGLPPVIENGDKLGYELGDGMLILKPVADWYAKPTPKPNPRITVQVKDARLVEAELKKRGVTISDAVQIYDKVHPIGSFLDSEGNKIWFCS
jgi:catechol 2,3-dioxygenase-like lactoylglutathione lyase family enzyme